MTFLPIHKATRPGSRVNFPSLPGKCAMRRGGLVLLSGLSLLLALPARALETVMQDDFALASGVPVNPAKWTVSASGVFKVNAGASWSFFQGILSANASSANAEVAGFSGKDFLVEFDLGRFEQSTNFFDLVLRQNAGGNTRVRFKANPANTKIKVAIMQPGSDSVSTSLGETSFNLGQYDWASFRVRINDSRVQVFAKETWNPEYTLLGEYVPGETNFINAGAGTVRIAMPQSSATNIVNLDGFKIRQADSGKKVFADFHGYRYTREHDGQLGNWKQALQSPQTPNHIANYNADLMDANGGHELASPGNPPIGMQSYNDPDYAEYHVLTAKMAGIDGFLHEYGCSAGLTDADVQLLQATAQTYGMEIGINWLDGFYYSFIESNAEYRAWCTTNSKNPALNATKLEYIPQVFQNLINWVYDKPNAATLGGKPLMPIFHGSPLTATEFATLKTKTYNYGGQTGVTVPFLMPRWAPMGLANESDPNVQKFWSDPWGWETQADGSYGWKPATERPITSAIYKAQGDERDAKEYARAHVAGMLKATNDRVNMAGVMPGFDNKFNAAWGQYAVELLDRKNGLTYTEVWDQYLRDRDVIDAVLVATWSDHTEGTGIEPMGDYGDRELRATAKYSAQFKGLADTSASLDFTLPKELFDLRKLAKFLESAGYPSSALSADRALLDSAAYDIAAGAYENAATKLSTTRTNLDTRRTNGIRETIHTLNFFTGSGVNVANSSDQYINIPDATADLVRSKNFGGVITFEYLDNSTFAANKTLYLLSYPAPANTGKPGENRSIQMQMRHGNGDRQWKTARVALNKKNLRLDHHVTSGALPIDLYFSSLGGASNGGTIRNVTVTLTTYEYSPPTSSVASGNWNAPATWTRGLPSTGSPVGVAHTVTFQDGDAWTGGTWMKGLLIGYDSWCSNWSLTGSGSGVLNVTGGNLTTGYIGLGAGLNGGNQTGTLNISGGVVTANDTMLIGWSTAGGSSVNVSGGVFNLTGTGGTFVVGHGAAAALNVSGGTVNLNRSLAVSNSSTLTVNGTGVVSINAGGSIAVSSGTLTVAGGGTLRFNGGDGGSANILRIQGGTVDVNGQSLPVGTWADWLPTGDGNRLLNSSTSPAVIATGNKFSLSNTPAMTTTIETVGNLTIHSWVTGTSGQAGGITKTGNGTLTLTNPGNDYTGHTVVNAGTLRFNHPTLANASDVRITSGAFLNLNFSGTDTVRSLYINGSKQAGGTWGAVGSGAQHQSPLITGTGFLQVANGAQFSDWATESGITGAQPGGDFDYDGITNLLEYALGLNPTAPSASPGTFDGSTISFNKGSAAVANDDLTYAIQTSTTLAAGSWTTVTPTVNSPSLISYTLPTGLTKIFARLLVSKIK